MRSYWWLTFRRRGYRGVCIVEAATFRQAIREARRLGCPRISPSGRMFHGELPVDLVGRLFVDDGTMINEALYAWLRKVSALPFSPLGEWVDVTLPRAVAKRR